MKSKCESFNEDDMMCCDCAKASVEEKQGCYRRIPLSWNKDVDKVHPDHYKQDGRRECIDEMIILFGRERVADWCRLTAYKYLYRHGNKKGESADTDMAKCRWYMDKAVELDGVEFIPLGYKYLSDAEKIEYRGHGVDKYVD